MVLARFGKTDKSDNFSDQNALIAVSVGQNYHSPEKFAALTRLIARSSFKKTNLMVADSLQAHNLLISDEASNLTEARELSRKHGDTFLETINISLSYYDDVIRWDTFINDSRYVEQKNFIRMLYNNNNDFAKTVDTVSGMFLAKHANMITDNSDFNLLNAIENCKDYITEELAVMMLWLKHSDDFPFNALIYPKPMHQAAKYIHDKYICNIKPNFLKELTYTFEQTDKQLSLNINNTLRQLTEKDTLLLDTIEDAMHSLQTKLITLKRELRRAREDNEDQHSTNKIWNEFSRILKLIKQTTTA